METDNLHITYIKSVQNNGKFVNELKGFKSKINYEDVFNVLEKDVKTDIFYEMEKYFNIFNDELKLANNISSAVFIEQPLKKISELPIDIEIYALKHTFDDDVVTGKIGFNIYLIDTECSVVLQTFQFYDFDISNDDIFKNYIYNIIFYIYIVLKNFEYNKLFNNIYHKDDINHMIEAKSRTIRLFGDKDEIDCCVCLENTVSKTICNHNLCHCCYSKLAPKMCPLCRQMFENDGYDDMNQVNIVFNENGVMQMP